MRVPSPPLAAVALALALAGCSGSQRPEADRGCQPEWAHVERVLRGGLERYASGMDRYVASTLPDRSTGIARARAQEAADRWFAAQLPGFLARCADAAPEARRCLASAVQPQDLGACGEGALVASFTDEVLPAYAADPLDPLAPRR